MSAGNMERVLRLIKPAMIHLDARLQGPKLGVEALLDLKEGDVLRFDYPVGRPLDLTVNNSLKYQGEIVAVQVAGVGDGPQRGEQLRLDDGPGHEQGRVEVHLEGDGPAGD